MNPKLILLGAAAGAIALAGCATVEEAVVSKIAGTYHAELTGAQEVGGGDPDGMATARVTVSDNLDQICYDVNDIKNLDTITGMHIHSGAKGVNGPPVLTLKQSNEGTWTNCVNRSEWLQDAIESDFTHYYVNIHTTAYPNGAIRGQLHS